jgi:TolB protein
MRVPQRQSLASSLAVALIVVAACDDPGEPVAPGSIEIVVVTSGQDVMRSNLRVTVGDAIVRSLDSAQAVTIDVMPGVHTIRLEGISENCQITSTNPRSATVESNRITVVTFAMACTARVGNVRVTTATTGAGLDPDGYTATVIGGPSQAVGTNATVTIADVREGQRLVTLTGVAPNCAMAGADTSTVTVPLNGSVDVSFSIECVEFGSLEVNVSTSGVDPDADGYSVEVAAASAAFAGSMPVDPNGSVTFAQLRPAADYRVTLGQVAPNCGMAGSAAVTVAVTEGNTTTVDIDVVCRAPVLLAIVRDHDIYTIHSSGAVTSRLTTDPAPEGEPVWSSTGRIAFTAHRQNDDVELHVMNDDGTNPMRLTTSFGPDDSPSWSPDGQRIVFRSLRDVNSELYTINADGSGLTRLTNNEVEDVQPAWSSTGKIAFISDRDHPKGELYVMDADGSHVVRLTNNDSTEANPAWSPDGSMIAFSREIECYYGCMQDIFVINADGSNVRRLATSWEYYQYHTDPSWSPNGRSIAFSRQYCGYYYCDAPSVWVVDLDGAALTQIAANAAHPAWKP